ncbi:MAG TPA: glycosyltransferase [Terrimicrobiaceae bacterium]
MPLRILFVPFGSEGDVNPLVWLAEGMAARGHLPSFIITPHYGHLIEQRGFAWVPVGTEKDFVRLARDPRVWDRRQGPKMVVQGMVESLAAYRHAFEMAGRDFDLVVLSSMALAASTIAEGIGLPRLTLHLQPALFRSIYECPLFTEELSWLTRAPRWAKRVFFVLVDICFWEIARRPLNGFRKEFGLPPLKNFFRDGFHGAERIAALFPEWFAAPQPDWPPRVRQFGFPITASGRPLPKSLENSLASGTKPVVWTHGSANFDIRHFQARAASVSRELNLRCLLVSLDPPDGPLSADVFHVSYARFEDLFPRCRAVVHHGGIGTTAKCLAAGVPQLIIPRSHDQPDNAWRVAKLGVGNALSYRKIDGIELLTTLRELLESKSIPLRCQQFRARLLAHDTLSQLCDWTEEMGSSMKSASASEFAP